MTRITGGRTSRPVATGCGASSPAKPAKRQAVSSGCGQAKPSKPSKPARKTVSPKTTPKKEARTPVSSGCGSSKPATPSRKTVSLGCG